MASKELRPEDLPRYELLTTGEAAEHGARLGLHACPQTWRYWALTRQLKAYHVSRQVVFRPDDFAAFVRAKLQERGAA